MAMVQRSRLKSIRDHASNTYKTNTKIYNTRRQLARVCELRWVICDTQFFACTELNLCLIRHVFTVWPPTSTSLSLVTKQCLMMFGTKHFSFGQALMCKLASRSPEPRADFCEPLRFFCFFFSVFHLTLTICLVNAEIDRRNKVFEFLSCVKFGASSFSVCIKFNFEFPSQIFCIKMLIM